MHGGDHLGSDARTRRESHPGGGAGVVRRTRDRHRALHVREHGAARAPDGGRADRGGRRRAGDLPPTVRGDALPEAGAACARARAGAALRRGRAGDRCAERRGLPPRGSRGELLRGNRRPPARGAGHEGGRARARADRARAPRRSQGVVAGRRRRRGRLGDRPCARGRGTPPRRRLLHHARAG